jgi:hypothetical protein
VEPLPALLAAAFVALGTTTYAFVVADAIPERRPASVADHTLDRVERTLRIAGVVRPAKLDVAYATVSDGYRANVTLWTADERWSRGPAPPSGADHARAAVSVSTPGGPRPGELRVVVW